MPAKQNEDLKEKALAALKADPSMGRTRLARALGVSEQVARRLIKWITAAGGGSARPIPAPKPAGVLTLADLRAKYDVAQKIRLGIAQHLEGQDAFVEDGRFREMCGVHIQHWRRYASLDEFAPYQIKLSGALHWADKRSVNKAREILGLS
jgi:hypothetical protein